MEGTKVVKRFPASVTLVSGQPVGGRIVLQKEPDKLVKKFKATKEKAVIHMLRESAMMFHKKYDPQIHHVTIVAREDPNAPAPAKVEPFKVKKTTKKK